MLPRCVLYFPLSIHLLLYFFAKGEKIGVTRFERATSWSQTKRSSQAELHPVIVLLFGLVRLATAVSSVRFVAAATALARSLETRRGELSYTP